MKSLQWAASAWAALGVVLGLPLVQAQAEPACPADPSAAEPATGAAAACDGKSYPSPLEVAVEGGGILGSLLLLRGPGKPRRRPLAQ